jgi:hypothetical protein
MSQHNNNIPALKKDGEQLAAEKTQTYQILNNELIAKTKWDQQQTLQIRRWYYFVKQVQLCSSLIEQKKP